MARFECVGMERMNIEGDSFGTTSVKILRDTETGIMYLFYQSGQAGGLTPLLGTDGKPEFFISSNEQ